MEDKDIMEQEEIVVDVVENPTKIHKKSKKSQMKVSDFQADIISMALLIMLIIVLLLKFVMSLQEFLELQGISFSLEKGIIIQGINTTLQVDTITILVFLFCVGLSTLIVYADGYHSIGREQEEQLIGIFPAVGMWGTFCGVALSLRNFNIHDIDQGLIEGLKTAVHTTVVGMTFFLWWTFTLIVKEKVLGKNEEQDPALVILNSIFTKMTDHMEIFTKEINDTIVEKLGAELNNFSEASKQLLEWYQQGMTKYTKSLKDMDNIYQKIQDTLTTLSKEISETLQSMSDTNIILENRNAMLTQQGELTEKWVENVKEVNDSVIQTSEVLNESLSQYQERFSTALEEASKAVIINIQQLSEQYKTYFDERQKDTDNMANHLNGERKENMETFKQEIEDQLFETKKIIEHYMARTLKEFSNQMGTLAHNYHEKILATLEETTKGHKEGFEQLHENIQKTNEFIKNSQENLNGTFDKINLLMDNKIKLSEKRLSKNIWGWSSIKKHEGDE